MIFNPIVYDHTSIFHRPTQSLMSFSGATAASSSAWIPLIYDTSVLLLTLSRAIPGKSGISAGAMMHEIVREGVLYYSVIFAVTFALTLMIASADPTIKNIAAQCVTLPPAPCYHNRSNPQNTV